MKKIILILVAGIMSLAAWSQNSFEWAIFAHQTGMYYSSERVMSEGFGLGAGTVMKYRDHFIAQADVNLLWANGNAITTRLAAGYARKGHWAPAISGTFNLLWGQRTEFLSESGERPASPVWVLGLRAAPLKFENEKGFVSALECGYGIGPDKGMELELSFLSVGVKL